MKVQKAASSPAKSSPAKSPGKWKLVTTPPHVLHSEGSPGFESLMSPAPPPVKCLCFASPEAPPPAPVLATTPVMACFTGMADLGVALQELHFFEVLLSGQAAICSSLGSMSANVIKNWDVSQDLAFGIEGALVRILSPCVIVSPLTSLLL